MDVRLMPEINYNPLRGKIRECGLTQKECAAKIGLSEGQLNRKLAGEYNFKQSEIHNLCDLLDIDAKEIGYYFFVLKVEKYQRQK
ncbi:DUF739 family protein [Hominenteromicrobium sp.]|uniref:DUF739 family protein n=1 Tax=Hominenteromicrobium sp. TaxID=3073581 RepID=UPI003A93B62A